MFHTESMMKKEANERLKETLNISRPGVFFLLPRVYSMMLRPARVEEVCVGPFPDADNTNNKNREKKPNCNKNPKTHPKSECHTSGIE